METENQKLNETVNENLKESIKNEMQLEVIQTDNKNDYIKRIVLCVLYAVFFTFCLYKNPRGITYPLFALSTIIAYTFLLKATKTKIKKFSFALMGLIMLLAVNVCTTGSNVLVVFDGIFVFVLFFVMFLNNFYEDKTWDVSRYFLAIVSEIGSSVMYVIDPVLDAIRIRKNGEENKEDGKLKNIGYVFLGLGISIPILCVVLPLLATSDVVFSNVLKNIFTFKINKDVSGVIWLSLLIFFCGYALTKRFLNKIEWLKTGVEDKRVVNPAVAITISAVLLVFYAVYSGIQIIYLFLGFGSLPDGYTYADYAHEGFFQLVFVCLINLVLVLICRKFSKDNRALKIMLTCICVCTYVMLFSSAYRMILYISVYGLTFLRVYVLWALTVIALVMAGTIGLIFKPEIPFVKYSLIVLTSTWAIFAFAHPDRIIADYNLSNNFGREYVLEDLSSDAVPVTLEYKDVLKDNNGLMNRYVNKWSNVYSKDDIRKFNFSDYCAAKALNDK